MGRYVEQAFNSFKHFKSFKLPASSFPALRGSKEAGLHV
jgi:hypothetical protein